MFEKKLFHDDTIYFFNPETKQEFGLIIGSLAWPTERRNGFEIIGGVGFSEDISLGGYPIQILAEYEGRDLESLFIQAVNLQREYSIDDFFTNLNDKINMDYFYIFDQRRREKKFESIKSLQPAPSSGLPDSKIFYSQLLRKYTRQGRRLLQFHKGSPLPQFLENISLEGIKEEYPVLMSLGYVLAVLDQWRPQKGDNKRNPDKCDSDFKIFDDGKKPDPYRGEPIGGLGMDFSIF
jgi:hypothetical protein